jgi:hypothetical protein
MATFTAIFAVGTLFSVLVAVGTIDFLPADYPFFEI